MPINNKNSLSLYLYPHMIDNKCEDKYTGNIIDKLVIIYNLLRITTKKNLLLDKKINVNRDNIIIFQSKFKIQPEFSGKVEKVIFMEKRDLIKNMQDLHWIHWNWIDNNNIEFNRNKFVNFCAGIWRKNITTTYSHIISFRHIYNKFKNLEKRIPCSYALIFNRKRNKCLLIRHHNSNKWSLPGGKIEFKETQEETLKREIYEELGIKCTTISNKYHDEKIDKRKFRCYIIELDEKTKFQTQSPFEIAEIKWWPVTQFPRCTKLLNYIKGYLLPNYVSRKIL